MDALLDSYGGAKELSEKIDSMRDYETRKRIAGEKGYGEMLEKMMNMLKILPGFPRKINSGDEKIHIRR